MDNKRTPADSVVYVFYFLGRKHPYKEFQLNPAKIHDFFYHLSIEKEFYPLLPVNFEINKKLDVMESRAVRKAIEQLKTFFLESRGEENYRIKIEFIDRHDPARFFNIDEMILLQKAADQLAKGVGLV